MYKTPTFREYNVYLSKIVMDTSLAEDYSETTFQFDTEATFVVDAISYEDAIDIALEKISDLTGYCVKGCTALATCDGAAVYRYC